MMQNVAEEIENIVKIFDEKEYDSATQLKESQS